MTGLRLPASRFLNPQSDIRNPISDIPVYPIFLFRLGMRYLKGNARFVWLVMRHYVTETNVYLRRNR